MMILSEQDIAEISLSAVTVKDAIADVRAVEAAILAKLASAELPEPTVYSYNARTHMNVLDAYTADQLRQAYAQGAAAQISAEPACWVTPDGMGFRMRLSPPVNEIPLGWQELYTRRQA